MAVAALTFTSAALAWDGVASGNVSQLDTINESNNYELRVYLGGAKMCNNTDSTLNTWAYLNSSDPNYKGTLANLMLAYATGKTVTIFTMNDGGAGCHIHYVMVRG
ncbi:MAG TPA: hypothetical protein VHV83_19260 [Armatimonadota bacterium]|nr:hypothetical protein [Armatimonadota bacterium]